MFQKSDFVALWRNARIAYPTIGLVKHLAGRELQLIPASFLSNDRQVRAIRSPVGLLHTIHDFARGSTKYGKLGERAHTDVVTQVVTPHQDCHFSSGGNGKNLGVD